MRPRGGDVCGADIFSDRVEACRGAARIMSMTRPSRRVSTASPCRSVDGSSPDGKASEGGPRQAPSSAGSDEDSFGAGAPVAQSTAEAWPSDDGTDPGLCIETQLGEATAAPDQAVSSGIARKDTAGAVLHRPTLAMQRSPCARLRALAGPSLDSPAGYKTNQGAPTKGDDDYEMVDLLFATKDPEPRFQSISDFWVCDVLCKDRAEEDDYVLVDRYATQVAGVLLY